MARSGRNHWRHLEKIGFRRSDSLTVENGCTDSKFCFILMSIRVTAEYLGPAKKNGKFVLNNLVFQEQACLLNFRQVCVTFVLN